MNTLLYPLLGTLFTFLMSTLGSALVFFFKDEIKDFYQQLFLGFAVGLTFAIAASNSSITFASALALALGIGLQNLPEGAAISLPLKQEGMSRTKAFVYGSLSGIVEPIAGVIAGFTIHIMQTILPICLSFAAGAMMYVVVEELIPEAQLGKHSHVGTFGVLSGFVIMMLMDVFLG